MSVIRSSSSSIEWLCKSSKYFNLTTTAIPKRFVTRKYPVDRDIEYDLPGKGLKCCGTLFNQ